MTSNLKVYLAGPIKHDPNPGRWREEIQGSNTHRNIEFVNPLDLEANLDDPEDVVQTDLKAIKDCDALLVRWKTGVEMAGTPMEMMFSAGVGVPIVTWYEGQEEDLSPWVIHFSDVLVDKGSEAIGEIQKVV